MCFSLKGQPVHHLGCQFCVGVLLQWRDDDVIHLCGISVVQLRYSLIEFYSLVADAGHPCGSPKLRLSSLWPASAMRIPQDLQTEFRGMKEAVESALKRAVYDVPGCLVEEPNYENS
jgi:hypothetical protein